MGDPLLIDMPHQVLIPQGDRRYLCAAVGAVHEVDPPRLRVGNVAHPLIEVESTALALLHMVRTHPDGAGLATEIPAPDRLALADVAVERNAQVNKWGDQHHGDFPDGRRPLPPSVTARRIVEALAADGRLTWWDILREELAEAQDESDHGTLEAFYTELIQATAVLLAWAEDVKSRIPTVP